jgi:hypothetical protein
VGRRGYLHSMSVLPSILFTLLPFLLIGLLLVLLRPSLKRARDSGSPRLMALALALLPSRSCSWWPCCH